MSNNLKTSQRHDHPHTSDVHMTSFSGGAKGQLIQMHTGFGDNKQSISMTEQQVKQTVATLATWLAER